MTKQEFLQKREAIKSKMANLQGDELAQCERELNTLLREFNEETAVMQRDSVEVKPEMSRNEQMREAIKSIRKHEMDGDIKLRSNSQSVITSAKASDNDTNNMASAGIPVTIEDLLNPLEMGLVYDKLGLKVATGVRGQLQWPCLDSTIEATIGGELAEAGTKELDFSKITAAPKKLGVSVQVDNEAINDASFDLVSVITTQLNKAIGRVLNKRILAVAEPSTVTSFVGPLEPIAVAASSTDPGYSQKVSFATQGAPTYKEIKKLKAKVLKTGAEMVGFCYVMDAAMYSQLEATPKDSGSGRFIIENGTIDGAPVFLVADTNFANKVAAGCFGYVALNQHGDAHLIIDPYTQAKKNVTVFTLNADWSITVLKSEPFAVGA